MGNLPSSRRNNRISQNPPQPARMIPPPPGYPGGHVPYYYPPNNNGGVPASHYFHQNYIPNNGPYVMTPPSLQPYSRSPLGPPPPPNPPRIPEVAEQKANTIRNDVNLKKATLRLERDEENPGYYLVAFTFDAMVPGSLCIFFLSREGPQRRMEPLKPQIFSPVRISFEKGLGQKFRQAPGTGVMLALFDDKELVKARDDNTYPLVVRTETTPKKPPGDEEEPRLNESIGGPLPSSVHSQATHAIIERKDDDNYLVRVTKQIIWVDGMSYELQEIYGIENSQGGSSYDGNDSGKECVICMSEPRDTTVLPCRHMCMCSECAKVLRFQTSRCPICRAPVDQLLEIKVAKNDPNDMRDVKVEGSSHQSKLDGGPSDSKHVRVEGSSQHSNLGEGASDSKHGRVEGSSQHPNLGEWASDSKESWVF